MLNYKDAYRLGATTPLVIVLCAILSGCGLNRWLPLEPGTYAPASKAGAAGFIELLEVDRDNQLASLTLADGTRRVVSFTSRERSVWPSGCPANIGSTHMEVLDIVEQPLTIGEVAFDDPILARDCPPDPEHIVLREDGPVGGGGSACAGVDTCLTFGRQSQAVPILTAPTGSAEPLPTSMKGYELYSWYEKDSDSWRYTLVTGTNRLKTVEEITAEENEVTGSGWVKITVTGTEDLKALLKRLLPGSYLTWRGPDWLEGEPAATANISLPEPSVVEVIQDHCRQLEIELHLAPTL